MLRMDRKPLVEDSQAFAQNIVDTVREPLLILDEALCVHSANRAFYKTFRVSPTETEDYLIYELGKGQWNIPALRTLLEDIIPQSSVFNNYELEYDFPIIGHRVMLLNARKLRSGDHTDFLVLAIEDVTELRRIHDLELQFTEELQDSYQRLQALERLREDLTNMIVHDLRTPLTSVITGIQVLEMLGDLDESQREMLGIILDGGNTLLGMINNLLDVEKMESGSAQLDYTSLNATELVARATTQVAALIASGKLVFVKKIADGLPPFQGDENKLCRVLVNLLGNAIKFAPAGGTLTVDVRFSKHEQSLVFSVSDTGEGISPETFEHIFEKFAQVGSNRERRMMGTGLGLTFCKSVIKAHGGHIGVESVVGEGSTFSFTIPQSSSIQTRQINL